MDMYHLTMGTAKACLGNGVAYALLDLSIWKKINFCISQKET